MQALALLLTSKKRNEYRTIQSISLSTYCVLLVKNGVKRLKTRHILVFRIFPPVLYNIGKQN